MGELILVGAAFFAACGIIALIAKAISHAALNKTCPDAGVRFRSRRGDALAALRFLLLSLPWRRGRTCPVPRKSVIDRPSWAKPHKPVGGPLLT
jgi:hypothetical protein